MDPILQFQAERAASIDGYGKDAGFVQECFGCHQPVKDNDWVFTHRAVVP